MEGPESWLMGSEDLHSLLHVIIGFGVFEVSRLTHVELAALGMLMQFS
jgi:hypothetical protein